MNQMSSSLDSHWSNRRNEPRYNKRAPEEQEKELYDNSPYPTHPIYLVYGSSKNSSILKSRTKELDQLFHFEVQLTQKKRAERFFEGSSPISAESIDSPGTYLPQLGTFQEGAYTKVFGLERQKIDAFYMSKADTAPLMLPRSAYRGIEREDRGPEQVGLGYRAVSTMGVTEDALVWFKEGYDPFVDCCEL
ncbi:cytochrome c oxidase subunit 1 [Stylosanthes scabra]|uniref:Cytochrome c oxidase subunit 1 n=1 Tax=Stylosanthes scabra TaxID=79078 RepID=A0ABU6ZPU0_9FABA|nr:cytochrome c oxidase subunit 1 [Stylosanthes scabra]